MNSKNITLKRGKDASLNRFHPWIFSGAIAKMNNGITDGDVVKFITAKTNMSPQDITNVAL